MKRRSREAHSSVAEPPSEGPPRVLLAVAPVTGNLPITLSNAYRKQAKGDTSVRLSRSQASDRWIEDAAEHPRKEFMVVLPASPASQPATLTLAA